MQNFDTIRFNKAVGSILLNNRQRLNLSTSQVSKKIKHLTPFEIRQIENGQRSLPCYVLYDLLQLYRPTEDEVFFFCCPQKTKEQFTIKH